VKPLSTMCREGTSVNRNWVKGSGIFIIGRFGGFGVVKFNACYSVTPVKLLEPKSAKSPLIIYSSDPVFLTLFTFVRTSKAVRVSPIELTRTTFSDSWEGLGKRFTVGGGMSDVVGFAIAFIKGLYYRELLLDAEPDVDRRNFYLARDIRVLPGGKLAGYHSRFIAWFDRLNDLVHFPSRVEFAKPGDKNAKPLYLSVIEAKERLGITGDSTGEVLLKAFERLGYAVQASLAYTRASKTDVFSGEAYALERIMLELEPKGSKDLSGVRDTVLRALDGLSPYVETPIVIFSGNKSYYVVLELSRPIRAGEYDIRDRLGVVVRRVSLGEVHRAFYELIVRRYLRNDNGITRYLDNQVAEPKRLLRIPGFKHEVSGQPAQLLDTDLRPIDLDPSVMDRAILAKDALTDVWSFVYQLDIPRSIRTRVFPNNYAIRQGDKWDCLPAWVRALITYLEETGELCHYGRMAVAVWMLWCGFSDEEIHEVFKHAHNYRQGTTQSHINDVRKYLEKGGKPMGCETVVEKCNGYKVPDIDCKAIRKSPTQPRPLEPKPEVQPTPVTETKPEVKPTEPKPKEPIPEVPKPETSKTKPGKPSTTNTSNRKVIKDSETKTGKQAHLGDFIDKPRQPTTQTTIEEDWSKILRPEKRRVIDCKELGDECRFYEDWEELREWRSWSGEHIFEPPEPELKDIISPQTHERLHKQLYDLVINGKQQEALKLWDEFFNKVLARRMEERLRGD